MINAPVLAHYDFSKQIIIQADASSYGLGAALMQSDKSSQDKREIIAYASRTLTSREKNYSQIKKEALALSFATERFREYIIGLDIKFNS